MIQQLRSIPTLAALIGDWIRPDRASEQHPHSETAQGDSLRRTDPPGLIASAHFALNDAVREKLCIHRARCGIAASTVAGRSNPAPRRPDGPSPE